MPRILCFIVLMGFIAVPLRAADPVLENARLANEGFERCGRFVAGWLKAMGSLNEHYRNFWWEGNRPVGADGYADSIESALNLYNREPVASTATWIDSEIQVMWTAQQEDGIVEGWHGDGNFARTTLMYCLWKTCGVTIRPWREDVVFGAVEREGGIELVLRAERPWEGRVLFDTSRHRTQMKMPLDWPRINQMPEWFTVEADREYRITDPAIGDVKTLMGHQLSGGVPLQLKAGVEQRWRVIEVM